MKLIRKGDSVMIDFGFNDEQRLIQKTVRDFCKNEIVPIVRKSILWI